MNAKSRFATAAFVGMICALAAAWPAAAGTIYVDDDALNDPGPGDPAVSDPLEDGSATHPYDAIQQGINAAIAGDTVLVADGTYTGTGNKDLDFAGKAITVRSASGNPATCIIDCQGSGRGFYFHSGETAAAMVDGFTIQNGRITSGSSGACGAGVYCNASSPTLANCQIVGNTASVSGDSASGGGLYCYASAPALVACTISGNTVYSSTGAASGGGVYCRSSSPSFTNCKISGNAGAGVYCYSSSPSLTGCYISGNSAPAGGGIFCSSSASPVLTACTISANAATQRGGGVYCDSSSSPALTDSTISGNTASSYGGGLYLSGGSPTLTNCTISGNTAFSTDFGASGGGLACDGSTPTLTNCIITANTASSSTAPTEGGALYCSSSNPTLTNCTIAGNAASPPPGESAQGGAVCCVFASPRLTNCILWGDTPQEVYVYNGSPAVTYCDVQGGYSGTGNINLAPGFAFASDFHLVAGSPCIDVGTNTPTGGLPPHDADANPRPLDGNGDGQARADIGAYEFRPTTPAIALNVTRIEFHVAKPQTNLASQTLSIRDAGGATLNWALAWTAPWLQADVVHGQSTGQLNTVTLTADASTLSHGVYSTVATVSDPQASNSPCLIQTVLYVNQALQVPSAYPTIQAAIDATVPGDEVVVADGIYTGIGNKDLDFHGKPILVHSASGNPATCIIDCEGSGRGFYFHTGETAAATVAGFTIRNGTVTYSSPGYARGGGMHCLHSSPTIANCTLIGNAASSNDYVSGGGVYCAGSSPTLVNCSITGNAASTSNSTIYASGGGVSCYGSSPTLINCSITANTGWSTLNDVRGAGVYCDSYSSPTLTHCTISDNTGSYVGGGLYCSTVSSPTLTHCTISGNIGGGVYSSVSRPTLASCTISGNTAPDTGGAVYCYGDPPRLTNCTITGNAAVSGGALYCYGCSPSLINCTFSGNRASAGGAVYITNYSDPTLTNSVLWGDVPQEIYVYYNPGHAPAVTYCDVQGGYTGTGNLNLDPFFINPAGGDYHLGPLSPCIDAGNPTSDFSLEPEPDGGRINMGAYGNTPEAETKGWIYIQGYNIASKTRIGRTLFQYDLTATVHNASSSNVNNLVATLRAVPSNVTIVSGTLNVGAVSAGATVVSPGTFTIRVNRSTAVSPLPISWRVTYGTGLVGEFTTLLDLGVPPHQPGDANCDGHVDFDDINPFVLALTGADGYYNEYPECDWLNADCNGDGRVDFDDINPFVELLTR